MTDSQDTPRDGDPTADGGQPQTATATDTTDTIPQQAAAATVTDARDIPDADLRSYYQRAADVWATMSTFDDAEALIVPGTASDGVRAWYKYRDATVDSAMYDDAAAGRAWSAVADRDDIVDELLDWEYRLPHLTINYQQRSLDDWATKGYTGDGDSDWLDDRPLPGYGDIDAVALFADVDFSADAKERPVDDDTRSRVETILRHWRDEYAAVVDDRDAVAMLDSVGGTYIMLRPAVTAPIGSFAAAELDAAERQQLMNELQTRWRAFNSAVDDAAGNWDAFHQDGDTNKNRLFKAPLAIHKSLPGVVTPIDVDQPRFELTHWADIDDELIDTVGDWADWFTDPEPAKADDWAGRLLAELFDDVDAANWRDDIKDWAEDRGQRDAAAQTQTLDDIDVNAQQLAADISFVSERDAVWDAIADLNCENVASELGILSDTEDAQRDDATRIKVNWRQSDSTDSAIVGVDGFTDLAGMEPKGGPASLVAYTIIGGRNHEPEHWRRDPDAIQDVIDWFLSSSFDIPIYIPQQGAEYETSDDGIQTLSRTPNWAIRRVAELLDIAPPTAFDDETDECIVPSLYNRILAVLEAADVDHNRDRKDVAVDAAGDDVTAKEYGIAVDDIIENSPADIPSDDAAGETDSDAADDAAGDAGAAGQSVEAETWTAKYGIHDRDSVTDVANTVAIPGVELRWIELADGRAGWGWAYEYTDENGQPREDYEFVLNADLELLSRLDYPERREQQTEWRIQINPTVPGEPQREVTLTPAAFNSARTLRDELIGKTESVVFNAHGKGAKAVNELKQLVHAQDAPRRKAHEKIELVDTDDGAAFVTPNGTIDADGWIDQPEHVFESVADGVQGDWRAAPDVIEEADDDLVAEVCELLPRIRDDRQQWLSMLGFAFASSLRPVLFDQPASQVNTWNMLHVSGKSGAGKSAVAKTLAGALGMNSKSTTGAEKTAHAQEHMFSATNGMPVAMDEYNPQNWANWKADAFHEHLKKSTDAQSIEKGNPDQSLTEYRFEVSPIVLGEQQLPESMPALPRRAVEVTLQTMSTAKGTATADRFNRLRGLKDDDWGLGLHHHAVSWWQHVCAAAESPIDVVNDWHETADWLRNELAARDVDIDDELPRAMHQQGLQTVAFGLRRWRAFARDRGADAELLFDDDDIIDTVEHLIDEKTGEHASSVDNEHALLELLGDAAAIHADAGMGTSSQEYAAYGEHYTTVYNETDEPTELRLHLKSTLTQLSKFSRDYGLDATIYQRADYYRWFKSAAENPDSIVIDVGQRTRLNGSQKRCIAIDLEQLTEQLNVHRDDLIPEWIVADARADDGDDDDDADGGSDTVESTVDIENLSDGDRDVAVSGTVDAVDDDQPDAVDHKATISDDTGSIEATVWAETVSLTTGDAVTVAGAYVDTFDGRLQLNISDTTTVDTTSGDDIPGVSDGDPGGNTLAVDDSSDTGSSSHKPGKKRSIYQQLQNYDSGDEFTAADIAKRLGLSADDAAAVLDDIATKGKKIETTNDGYRML